jgi:hypothetical protein
MSFVAPTGPDGHPLGAADLRGAGTVAAVNAPRRAPNFTRFLATGAILGFIVGSAVAFFGRQAPGYGEGAAVAYLGLLGAGLGAMLAGVVAVLLDRRR